MAPAIPDRWLDYTSVGTRIEGTSFICFKVPLSKNVQKNTGAPIWDVETLVKSIPDLGCVIDLTNTARYYTGKEFEDKGVKHVKIMVPGRVIPPESIVKKFFDAVQTFTTEKKEKLIGVHCTHGLNRTGYFVCRYMRDQMTIAADDAIANFEKARGHTIERQNFLADLRGLADIPPPDSFRKSPTKGAIARQANRNSVKPYITPDKSWKNPDVIQDASYSKTSVRKSEASPEKSNRRNESSHSNDYHKSYDSTSVRPGNSNRKPSDQNSRKTYRTSDGDSRWSSGNANTNYDNYDRRRYDSNRNSGNSYGNSVDSNRDVDDSDQNYPVRTRFTSNRSYNNDDRDNYDRGGNRYRDKSFNNYSRSSANDRKSAEITERSSRCGKTNRNVSNEEGNWRRR